MDKSSHVRVIEVEEIRRDDPIKHFFPMGSEEPLESQRG